MKQSFDSIEQQVELPKLPKLTNVERKYFKHLVENLDKMVSTEDIKRAVYGEQALDRTLVSQHMGNIASKLDKLSRDTGGAWYYRLECPGTGGNGYRLVLISAINALDSPKDIACVEPRELRLDQVNLWGCSNHYLSDMNQVECIHSWATRLNGGGLANINIVGDWVSEGRHCNSPLKIAVLLACFELGHLSMLCRKDQHNGIDIYTVTSESAVLVGTEDVLMKQESEQSQEAISRTKFLRRNIDSENLGRVDSSVVAKNVLVQAFDKCIWDQLIDPFFEFYALRWFDSIQTLLVCGECKSASSLKSLYIAKPYGIEKVLAEKTQESERSALLRHTLSDISLWRI